MLWSLKGWYLPVWSDLLFQISAQESRRKKKEYLDRFVPQKYSSQTFRYSSPTSKSFECTSQTLFWMLLTKLKCFKSITFLKNQNNHLLRLELRCQKVEGERERWRANNDDNDESINSFDYHNNNNDKYHHNHYLGGEPSALNWRRPTANFRWRSM